LDNRVLCGVKMFGGVLVFGIVAATDVAANFTQPQMHPIITKLQAFLASVRARRNFPDLVKMYAIHFRTSTHDCNI